MPVDPTTRRYGRSPSADPPGGGPMSSEPRMNCGLLGRAIKGSRGSLTVIGGVPTCFSADSSILVDPGHVLVEALGAVRDAQCPRLLESHCPPCSDLLLYSVRKGGMAGSSGSRVGLV